MSLRRAVALLVLSLALLLAVSASGVGGVAAQTGAQPDETALTEETVIEIQLEADGDAVWRVTEQFAITDEAERAAFDDLGDSFESGAASPLGLDTFQRALDDVASETDRSMQIRDIDRNATREEGSFDDVRYLNGTMSLSFTWTNFAREIESQGNAEGQDEVVTYQVRDVFNTSHGTWFGGLGSGESFVINLPERTNTIDTPRPLEDGTMRWNGPTSFPPGYLTIEYNTRVEPAPGPSLAWIALLVAVVASFGAGALLIRRREGDPLARVRDALGAGTGDGPDGEEEPPDTAADDTDAGEDLELLSDEERVERLLEENGGRMKQANIVKETGWSNAKVSQLLSSMEDEDRIAKLRIGRENLISFPDEDVGDFDQ